MYSNQIQLNEVAEKKNRFDILSSFFWMDKFLTYFMNELKRIPKIYFATRTHKQITNVIKELKKTGYADEVRYSNMRSHFYI